MKKQKNKCNICGSPFQPGDIIEVDRITPKALGGKNLLTNFQLLHGHCHDYKKNVVFEEEKDIECVEKKWINHIFFY